MGTFNANILPTTTGLSLGSQVQKWLLNGLPAPSIFSVSVAFSSTPSFSSTNQITFFTMTLTNNVTSSTLSLPGVTVGLVIFQFTIGTVIPLTFVWPTNVNGGVTIGNGPANQVTTQAFVWDGTTAWALGPGTIFP